MATKTKSVSCLLWVSAAAGLIGLGVYLYTSFTGYLASSGASLSTILCTAAAVVLMALAAAVRDKMPPVGADLLVMVSTLLLIVGFAFFALVRVPLAADVYFIPVNYPAAEATALHTSIVGLVFELVGIVCGIAAAFSSKLS